MIQWDDSLSVNVAAIDLQHKKLVKVINELDDAMRVGKSKAILGSIVNRLIGYVRVHFSTEEKYFVKFNYLETEQHTQEHRAFSAKVDDLERKFQKGQLGLSIDVMIFLSDWLAKHIKGTDKKYGACFNANGFK